MSRSKKVFAAFAIAFLLFLLYVVYDISSRTTFPGSGTPDKNNPADTISLQTDSLEENSDF